ncbi:MAG: virulence RhuM family protein, partial [Bacteroidales bacterium]|nr:virulence RhuM family protein [Bacteroidales bacterium]
EDYITYYNLDVIISVGYRVKSKDATAFRIWATSVLKEYLIKGYAINPRIEKLERRVSKAEEKIDFFVKTSLPPVEGIFFDGQIYDAYEFVCGLIKSAKVSIVLIDNYVDDTVLTMMDKRETGLSATIYTQMISPQLQLDLDKHNSQYPPIEVVPFNKAHDRFLIIDDKVYHIGASLKDLGKKWFAFSLMNDLTPEELVSRL